MQEDCKWKERYKNGDTPWDTGRPDATLVRIVAEEKIAPCKALELGCGTGSNAIWLAKNHFSVTAVDVSQEAIEIARTRADEAGVNCRFIARNILFDKIPDGPFEFAFDRGCFHVFDTAEERNMFAERVAVSLAAGGTWFSLIGSADDPPRDSGPPRRTAREMINAVEPFFEILSLSTSFFDSKKNPPPRAWQLLLRKRIV